MTSNSQKNLEERLSKLSLDDFLDYSFTLKIPKCSKMKDEKMIINHDAQNSFNMDVQLECAQKNEELSMLPFEIVTKKSKRKQRKNYEKSTSLFSHQVNNDQCAENNNLFYLTSNSKGQNWNCINKLEYRRLIKKVQFIEQHEKFKDFSGKNGKYCTILEDPKLRSLTKSLYYNIKKNKHKYEKKKHFNEMEDQFIEFLLRLNELNEDTSDLVYKYFPKQSLESLAEKRSIDLTKRKLLNQSSSSSSSSFQIYSDDDSEDYPDFIKNPGTDYAILNPPKLDLIDFHHFQSFPQIGGNKYSQYVTFPEYSLQNSEKKQSRKRDFKIKMKRRSNKFQRLSNKNIDYDLKIQEFFIWDQMNEKIICRICGNKYQKSGSDIDFMMSHATNKHPAEYYCKIQKKAKKAHKIIQKSKSDYQSYNHFLNDKNGQIFEPNSDAQFIEMKK